MGRGWLAEGEDIASPDSGGVSGVRGQEGEVGMGVEANSGPPSLSSSKTHLKPFKRNHGKGELGNLLQGCDFNGGPFFVH